MSIPEELHAMTATDLEILHRAVARELDTRRHAENTARAREAARAQALADILAIEAAYAQVGDVAELRSAVAANPPAGRPPATPTPPAPPPRP